MRAPGGVALRAPTPATPGWSGRQECLPHQPSHTRVVWQTGMSAPQEIVPLLSGVLARRSGWAVRGFSRTGPPDDQQIMRQHAETQLDPRLLQPAAAEPT